VVITEEDDIKPVILRPPSPNGQSENTNGTKRNDQNEIDILMDELLQDVEVNVAAEPKESAKAKPATIGLSIRKDIFMSPKKEVIALGDSPPKSASHENHPQTALNGSIRLRQPPISMSASSWMPENRVAGPGMVMPLRNIAPKPSSNQLNFPQHQHQQLQQQQHQQHRQQHQLHQNRHLQQQQQLPLTLPNLQQQQPALMKPASVSQNDMRVAYEQLKALEALQATKGRQEVHAKQWPVPAPPPQSGDGFTALPLVNSGAFQTNAADFLFQPDVVKDRPPRTYNRYKRNKIPLFHDPTLPPGWSRKVTQRMTGATAGGWDTYLIDPTGKRFRSKQEIRRHFERIGEVFLRWEDFDFNPFGSKGQVVEEDQNIPFWEEPGDLDPSDLLDDKFHCPQACGVTFSSREECLSHEMSCKASSEEAMDASQFLKTEILE